MQIYYRSPIQVAILAATALILASAVLAQPTPGPEKQEVVVLDRYVVTGSHLLQPADALSVASISATDIEKGGIETNLLDVLRKQMPAFSGSGNLGTSNGSTGNTSTYGGAQIALHNMPTLVLINGRRVATNGANGRGGSNFVDVNQIPLSAIDHVEVLSDGASAIYGSDAIGGVVNVILKSNFNGSEVGGGYGFSTRDGDYSEKSAHFTTGAGNGGMNVFVTGDYFKSTPLMQTDRPFSSLAASTSYSGVIGTSYLNPALKSPSDVVPVGSSATAGSIAAVNTLAPNTYLTGVPALNLAKYVTLLMAEEKKSAYAGLTYKLADQKLEVFGDVLYSDVKSFSQLGAQSTTFNGSGTNPPKVAANTPYNPTTTSLSPSFRYVPAPRRYDNDAVLARLTAGLRGELSSSWSWETAYTYNENRLTNHIENVLFKPNLNLAVLGGYDQNGNILSGGKFSRVYSNYTQGDAMVLQPALDPFASSAGIDPATLANVLGVARADFKSTLSSCDAVVRGNAFSLPAGDLAIAIGGDYREEGLIGTPDQNSRNTGPTAQLWAGATAFDPFDKERHITAGYAEVRLPVTSSKWDFIGVHALNFTAAYRVEDYSDAGSSGVPKYSVSWQPIDEQVTFYGSYSKAFAAPRMFDLFGPTIQGFSNDLRSVFGISSASSLQATVQNGSNAALQPTTARTHSAGVVLAPKAVKGLKVTVDYTDVDIHDMVSVVGAVNILSSVDQLGTASPYINQVAFNNYLGQKGSTPITGPGQISGFLKTATSAGANTIFVSDTNVNVSSANVRTVDVAVDYILPTPRVGTFAVGTAGTYYLHDRIQVLPTMPYYAYAGLATTPSGGEGTIPDYRFYSTLAWQYSDWDVRLGNTFISSVDDIGPGGSTFANSTTIKRVHIPSYSTWDIGVGYTLRLGKTSTAKTISLRVGVNNVMDKMPPAAPQAFPTTSAAGADAATYSPIGRLYYVSADYRF